MKKFALTFAALAGMALIAAPSIAGERHNGETQLAKLLEGRVAGQPQNCLNTRTHSNSQVIDKTAVVYGRGRTIWVNVPDNARHLDDSDVLMTRQFGSKLCSQDIVTTYDSAGRFYTGNLSLGKFVPYTRVN